MVRNKPLVSKPETMLLYIMIMYDGWFRTGTKLQSLWDVWAYIYIYLYMYICTLLVHACVGSGSWRCGVLLPGLAYQVVAGPGSRAAAPPWPGTCMQYSEHRIYHIPMRLVAVLGTQLAYFQRIHYKYLTEKHCLQKKHRPLISQKISGP